LVYFLLRLGFLNVFTKVSNNASLRISYITKSAAIYHTISKCARYNWSI